MKQGRIETITTRIISATFVTVALAVFKPFGLDAWQWQAYVHLAALWVIGFGICVLTDIILKYVIKMPRSLEKGVEYIIRRNLWFQLINTPLVALGICLYRHFVLSGRRELPIGSAASLVEEIPSNEFSVVNYLETLVIIAFCSFAIGLYWRFKYRSKYLAMELEEIRELNEKLKTLPKPLPVGETSDSLSSQARSESPVGEKSAEEVSAPLPRSEEPDEGRLGENVSDLLTLTGTTNESVTLQISHLLYIEAVGNYVKVSYLHERPRVGDGTSGNDQVHTDMLRATMKQMEETLQGYPMIVRCHRAFLVNLGQVEQIVSHSGSTQLLIKHCHESLPVSRSNMAQVKAAIKRGYNCL